MRRSEIQTWDILYAITGHKIISSELSIICDRSQTLSESSKLGRINPKFATESEFNHICVLQYTYVTFAEIWSNNFCGAVAVHTSRMLMSEKRSIVSVLRTHPFTDWIIVLKLMPADRIGGNLPDKNTAGQKKHSLTVCTERTQSGATLETARYNYRCS